MSCETIQPELVGFHFGSCGSDLRTTVETHLLECATCLREYLEVKRGIELGDEDAVPSSAARALLRTAVANHLHPRNRAWRWWERPFALGLAGGAVAAAVMLVYSVAIGPGAEPWTLAHGPSAAAESNSR